MAQRRSRNRRLSSRRSSNVSGFLDDNTNVIDNNDPQWYNRTILRPSTSFVLTKNASSILNPDSMADETEVTSNWYKNLSRSESSKLMEEFVRSKVNNRKNESGDSTPAEPVTESESESESQKKRTKLRVNQKKVNMSDKSNVFLKAFEKTTDSHTRNLTVQMPEGNESESTNDDSRTIKRIRPELLKNNKRSKENTSNFDDLFHSDSTTENIQTSARNSRSSLKRKSKDLIEHTSTPEVAYKFRKTQLDKLDEVDSSQLETCESVNKTLDKTLLVTPIKKLSNKSIVRTPINRTPIKPSQKQAGSATVYESIDMSHTMVENKSQKKRATLFSQESKNTNDKNLFDEVFDEDDDNDDEDNESNPSSEHQLAVDTSSGKIQQQNADKANKDHEDNESETSSIPKYIRRTRSVALKKLNIESENEDILDSQGNHGETNDNENEESDPSLKHSQNRNSSRRSLRDSQRIDESRNLSKFQSKSTRNKSINKTARTDPNKSLNEKDNESSSTSKVIEQTKNIPHDSSEDENIVNVPKSTKATRAQNDNENEESDPSLKHSQNRNSSRRSLRDSQRIDESRNLSKFQSKSTRNKSINKTARTDPNKSLNEKDNESSSTSKVIEKTIHIPHDSSEDENIINVSKSTKATRAQNDNENEESDPSLKHSQNRNSSQRSLRDSQRIDESQNLSKFQSKSTINQSLLSQSTQSITRNRTASNKNLDEKDNESLSSSKVIETTKHIPHESSVDENIINISKSTKAINAQGETTSQTEAQSSVRISNPSQKSPKLNRSSRNSKSEPSDNERGNTMTPEVTDKSRSRLFKNRTRVSDGENAFDKILDTENSAASDKSKSINAQRFSRSLQSKKSTQGLNDTRTSSRSINKSALNQSENSSQANESVANQGTENDSQQEESEDETSTIPNHIRRTRSRLFQKSEMGETNASDDILDAENSGANQASKNNRNQSQKSPSLKLSLSQDSNRTLNKSISQLREVRRPNSQIFSKPQVVLQRIDSPKAFSDSCNESVKENQDANKSQKSTNKSNAIKNLTDVINSIEEQSLRKSNVSHTIEENAASEAVPDRQSSIETTSDETLETRPNENRVTAFVPEKSVNEDYLSDDLLHSPNPAQSTLKISGKRITQFVLRQSIMNEIDSPRSPTDSNRGPLPFVTDANVPNQVEEPQREEEKDGEDNDVNNEDVEVDVTNSDVSDYPMLTRHLNDIPYEAERSTFEEETTSPISAEPSNPKATKAQADENVSTIDESVWAKVEKKMDALKVMMEAQKKQQEAIQREREREKARIEAKLKRSTAQREAELKKKRKKPIDKAYYVNGQLYKQPKLPVPKKWVTDRLYKYLWKHMEPKFGISTRVQSEKFVLKLSNIFTIVIRRKKYDNYREDVDDLMTTMAKLGIIKDRYDFYRFCREFMPYSFRKKVVPIESGNVRNIPYDPELVHKPILPQTDNNCETQSDSDSNSRDNNENDSGSSSESE